MKKDRRQELIDNIANNTAKPCSARGCTQMRSRLSGYCKYHSNINNRFGHPLHKDIRRNHYASERKEAEWVVQLNHQRGHAGIKMALSYFKRLLEDGVNNSCGALYPDHFNRLIEYGVTPVDLLVELCGVHLLYHRGKRIYSLRHLRYMLAFRLLRMAPNCGFTHASTHKALGEALYGRIGILLVQISHACDRKAKQDSDELSSFYQPLEVSPPASDSALIPMKLMNRCINDIGKETPRDGITE